MIETKENKPVTLENLKGLLGDGYLIYTDATPETGEDKGDFVLVTDDTRPGTDQLLLDAGYRFIVDDFGSCRGDIKEGMFYMDRGEDEYLRYHPISDFDKKLGIDIDALNIKTRIDFFRVSETSVYDVVKKLLEYGYGVVVPLSGWIHFVPGSDDEYKVVQIAGQE